jgi:hypothetical protein
MEAVELSQGLIRYGDIMNRTTLGDLKYDAIIAMDILEHIEPDKVRLSLQNLAELLKDRGEILVTLPHVNAEKLYKHYQHFTVDSFGVECKGAGLRIYNYSLLNPNSRFVAYARWWLGVGNPYWMITNKNIWYRFYSYYKKHCFYAMDESTCKNIFFILRKTR